MSTKRRQNYTRRSLEHVRAQGYVAEVVEKFISSYGGTDPLRQRAGGFRKDLFGIIDIIGIHAETGDLIAVQSTSKPQVNPHLRKIEQSDHIEVVRKAPWRLVVHGWYQPGGARTRWQLLEVDFTKPTRYAVQSQQENRELF